MVWTRERFYIGRPASLDVIDTILLEDIDEVVEMDDELEPVQKLPTLAGRSSGLLKEISMQRSADLTSHRQLKISDSNLSTESESLHRSFIAQARLNNVLQIKTAADSLKSGRTYYVSTRCNPNAAESRRALVKQLSVQSKIARRKAEAKSRFQRSQEKVKAVQTSMPFQFIMATLIMAVRPPDPCERDGERSLPLGRARPRRNRLAPKKPRCVRQPFCAADFRARAARCLVHRAACLPPCAAGLRQPDRAGFGIEPLVIPHQGVGD